MSKISQFLDYAERTRNKVVISVGNYIYKLKERGYSDTDILHKLYNNYGFAIEVGQRGMQLVGANPYPHEHSARLAPPSKFKRFRRQNNKFGRGVHVIWGIRKEHQSPIVQAIRFDSSKFSEQQAVAWLKKHGAQSGDVIKFELARKEKL